MHQVCLAAGAVGQPISMVMAPGPMQLAQLLSGQCTLLDAELLLIPDGSGTGGVFAANHILQASSPYPFSSQPTDCKYREQAATNSPYFCAQQLLRLWRSCLSTRRQRAW